MEQYIPKSALVAEIERRKQEAINNCGGFKSMREHECDSCIVEQYEEMKNIINALEVKEVDLEEEINYWQGCEAFPEGVEITPLSKAMEIVERTARHFFELGIAVSNKVQKG